MSNLYGDNIFDEDFLINEGGFFHSPETKAVKKSIQYICKELSEKGFKNRIVKGFQGAANSKPSKDKLNRFNSACKQLFKDCTITDVVLKCRTYNTGYSTVYEEYYCIVISGIINNYLATFWVQCDNLTFYMISCIDKQIPNEFRNDLSTIFKILSSLPYKIYGVYINNKSITIKKEHIRQTSYEIPELANKLAPYFEDRYEMKVHKLMGYIRLKPRK